MVRDERYRCRLVSQIPPATRSKTSAKITIKLVPLLAGTPVRGSPVLLVTAGVAWADRAVVAVTAVPALVGVLVAAAGPAGVAVWVAEATGVEVGVLVAAATLDRVGVLAACVGVAVAAMLTALVAVAVATVP
jgi:hypothetical protein